MWCRMGADNIKMTTRTWEGWISPEGKVHDYHIHQAI